MQISSLVVVSSSWPHLLRYFLLNEGIYFVLIKCTARVTRDANGQRSMEATQPSGVIQKQQQEATGPLQEFDYKENKMGTCK